MENNQYELEFENQRLEQTISLAKSQLDKARAWNEENKLEIIAAKKEMRENTSHTISSLWSSEGFEALAALSQYVNPVINKIADFEAAESRISLLEQLTQSPYFARIDFKFEGEDVPEHIYIGRSSLMDEDSYDIYVYDWRSPIASVFYRFVLGPAFYEAPNGKIAGEMSLKRQYEIKKGVLEYFFDADVQIVDEFLRKLLSQNTSPTMKTIVETIQKEQDIVIRDMENELMMVQGVAGSGKTSIALHRAAYLMYQGLSSRLAANNIVIISPNALFEQYISHVLPELGEENVVSMLFEEILAKILQNEHIQTRNQFLEHLITSHAYRDLIKSTIEFKTSREFLEIMSCFIEDIPHRWIAFEDIYYHGECMISKEILKDKILSGRANTPLGLKLKQLEDFILESIRESHNERLNKSEELIIKKDIQKFTEINIHQFYKKLINDKSYFYSLAKGLELPHNMDAILTFTQENLSTDLLYYDDAAAISFLTLKLNGTNDYKSIKQVVIDEAQDYYPLHYEIFNLLFPNAKYTILGDINQTLEKQEDLSLYEQIKSILNKKKSSLITMNKSFRCTHEILEFSSKFIEQSLEIKSFSRKGDEPQVYAAPDQTDLDDKILSEIKVCLEKGYHSIGLICKTQKNAHSLFERLKDKIDLQLITEESTAALQGVFIIPVYMSKGLEFDTVLVCDGDSDQYSSQDDKKLLYIACTRALHRLNLFSAGEVSPLLSF